MTTEYMIEDERPLIESLYETEITSEYLPDDYRITAAIPNDIDAIIAMRERIADKLWKDPETGGQWRRPWPDDATQAERILESIVNGETYMVWGGENGVDLVGTFAVNTRGDSLLWTPEECEDDNALYLSRLMAAEKGIGDAIVQTVRDWGKSQEKEFIRIDVWDTNEKLIDYYAQPERGFQIVRQNPIDGYPSCTLMQAATDRNTPAEVIRGATQSQNERILDLPERVDVQISRDDLGAPRLVDPDVTWHPLYDMWKEREGAQRYSYYYCPRIDKGWFFDQDESTAGSLRFSSFLPSHQYNELLAKVGLCDTMISFSSQAGKVVVDRRVAIRAYEDYEKLERGSDYPLSTLLEGYLTENDSVQLRGGEVSLQNTDYRMYRLPTQNESGFQPAVLQPGDHVHVRISPDKTSADILKLANGEKSNEARERMEFGVRLLVNEIYAKLTLGETSSVYDLTQQFYLSKCMDQRHEEELLRATLQRHGVYAVDPAMAKLGLIDIKYNGMSASLLRESLVMQVQDGGVEDLRRYMTYFRTFEPYPEDYERLAAALWKRAEEFGCERDVMRTIYAKLVREMSWYRSGSESTANIIKSSDIDFFKFKNPLPITKRPDEI